MLNVCDYQWKCATTCINLILEARCPSGWHIANFFLFGCDSLQTPSSPPSLRVRSHQKLCILYTLTGAMPGLPSEEVLMRFTHYRTWCFLFSPSPQPHLCKMSQAIVVCFCHCAINLISNRKQEIKTVFSMLNFQNDLLQLLSVHNKKMS